MRKSQERSGRVTVFPSAYEAGSLGIPAANNVTERSRYFARNTSVHPHKASGGRSASRRARFNLAVDSNLPGAQRPSFGDVKTG
jgi:hypothetical protein